MQFSPSEIYLSQTTLQNATPNWIEDVTWTPQFTLLGTNTNKRRALPIQEVELDGWFSILHIVVETCTIYFMHKFKMGFVFRFYILGLTSWIWTSPLNNWSACEIWEPFKMKLVWGLQSWALLVTLHGVYGGQKRWTSTTHSKNRSLCVLIAGKPLCARVYKLKHEACGSRPSKPISGLL